MTDISNVQELLNKPQEQYINPVKQQEDEIKPSSPTSPPHRRTARLSSLPPIDIGRLSPPYSLEGIPPHQTQFEPAEPYQQPPLRKSERPHFGETEIKNTNSDPVHNSFF